MKSIQKIILLTLFACLSFSACGKEKTATKKVSEKKAKTDVVETKLSTELADKNASNNAKMLMDYFVNEVYGKKILTGVMDCAWSSSIDMDTKVLEDTGYQSALMGFDFMNHTKQDSRSWYKPTQVEKAINWWLGGGLVTVCWHWLDPTKDSASGSSYKPTEMTYRIPYDEKTGKLLVDSKEFEYIKKDFDIIAEDLDLMQQLGVVVLWRPMHEAKGNWGAGWSGANAWFWWGASGPDAYKELWKYMFHYFTEEKGLHNLIWVWNGQGEQWYPGDEYCDIVGYDLYDQKNAHGDGMSYYTDLMLWCKKSKMAAISECGYVPSTEALEASKAKWLYYMVWNDDDNLSDDTTDDNDNFWGGTKYNTLKNRTTDSFLTDYQIKLGDESLTELMSKME